MSLLPETMELERLRLNRNRLTDSEEIFYAYASKPEVTKYLSWKTHETLEETRSYLSVVDKTWRQGLQASYSVRLKKSNRLIGSCGCAFADGLFQVGYVFSPVFWGMGYATEACRGLVAEIRRVSPAGRICSFVDIDNLASARVLEKSGFIQEQISPGHYVAPNQGGVRRDAFIYVLPIK